jgi:hypothetical protein
MAGDAPAALGPEQAREPGEDAAACGQALVGKLVRPERKNTRQLGAPVISGVPLGGNGAAVDSAASHACDVSHDCSVV